MRFDTRHAVIEASAGTGKTYTLENLVVELLVEEGHTIDQILVVTFTEKAAFELQERLRSKLALELASAQGEARVRLEQAAVGFHGAQISTIHAFCRRILADHAFEYGRSLEPTMVKEEAIFDVVFDRLLREKYARTPALRALLELWLSRSTVKDLKRNCWQVLQRGGEIEPSFDPTKLRKAHAELAKAPTHFRAIRPMLVKGGLREPWLAQVGKLLAQAMTHHRSFEDGLPKLLGFPEPPPYKKLIEVLEMAGSNQPKLQHLVDALKLWVDAICPAEAAVLSSFVPHLRQALHLERRARGLVDFSDMVYAVDQALTDTRGATLAEWLRSKYPVALVDEFQDTDELQWRIFRNIYLEAPEQAETRLIVIGDPKQAIYGFRGADISTYLKARTTLIERGAGQSYLSKNFRSTPKLVRALEKMFDPTAHPPFFPGPVTYDAPSSPGRSDEGWISLAKKKTEPIVAWELKGDDEPKLPSVARALRAYAETVARACRKLMDEGRLCRKGVNEAIQGRDIFILCRSGHECTLVLEALLDEDLPAALHRQEGLLQGSEAHALLATLASVCDPSNETALIRAGLSPIFGLSFDELARGRQYGFPSELVQSILRWNELAERRRFGELLSCIISESGLAHRLMAQGEEQTLSNYQQICEVLLAEAKQGCSSVEALHVRLKSFVEERAHPFQASTVEQRVLGDEEAIQVMTIHKAKGLEAEIVFVFGGWHTPNVKLHPYTVGADRKLFVGGEPPPAALEAEAEETRRLAYVALTRAKTQLHIPYLRDQVRPIGGLQTLLEPVLDRVVHEEGFEVRPWHLSSPGRASSGTRKAPGVCVSAKEETRDRAQLVASRALPIVTSYSRMKAESAQTEGVFQRSQTFNPSLGAGDLPTGAATGLALHTLVENLDLDHLQESPSDEALELARAALLAHDLPAQYSGEALRIAHLSLTTSLRLRDCILFGLGSAERIERELEFWFPFPAHPERGFVKGFMDVVFTYRGLLYVLDWKSDVLERYDPVSIDQHVRNHYLSQAQLYAIAASRIVHASCEEDYEARFGGLIYLFMRGLNANQAEPHAQWFFRPCWRDIVTTSASIERLPPQEAHHAL